MSELDMAQYETVNVKPETKKKLALLKALEEYGSMDELINEEIDFGQVEELE